MAQNLFTLLLRDYPHNLLCVFYLVSSIPTGKTPQLIRKTKLRCLFPKSMIFYAYIGDCNKNEKDCIVEAARRFVDHAQGLGVPKNHPLSVYKHNKKIYYTKDNEIEKVIQFVAK